MLQEHGWQHGSGLGKHKQGRVYPVLGKFKNDRVGVGAAPVTAKAAQQKLERIMMEDGHDGRNQDVVLTREDYERMAVQEREDRNRLLAYLKS
jgi:G-patch domain